MFDQRLTTAEQRHITNLDEGTAAEPPRNSPARLNVVPNAPNAGGAPDARIEWVSKALCRSADPDELFVSGKAQRKATAICRHCPVVTECLTDALDNRIEFGVWGGRTERERRALLKKHPEVVSWSAFFAAQRKHRDTDLK